MKDVLKCNIDEEFMVWWEDNYAKTQDLHNRPLSHDIIIFYSVITYSVYEIDVLKQTKKHT